MFILNQQEILFVYEYLKDFDLKKAAIRVGVPKPYALKWARETYNRFEIQKAIRESMQLRIEKAKIDADWVLEELVKLYKLSLQEIIVLDASGEPTFNFSDASPELLDGIEKIDITPGKYGTKINVQLPSKKQLLETIGKHVDVNAFLEKVEHSTAPVLHIDEQDNEA